MDRETFAYATELDEFTFRPPLIKPWRREDYARIAQLVGDRARDSTPFKLDLCFRHPLEGAQFDYSMASGVGLRSLELQFDFQGPRQSCERSLIHLASALAGGAAPGLHSMQLVPWAREVWIAPIKAKWPGVAKIIKCAKELDDEIEPNTYTDDDDDLDSITVVDCDSDDERVTFAWLLARALSVHGRVRRLELSDVGDEGGPAVADAFVSTRRHPRSPLRYLQVYGTAGGAASLYQALSSSQSLRGLEVRVPPFTEAEASSRSGHDTQSSLLVEELVSDLAGSLRRNTTLRSLAISHQMCEAFMFMSARCCALRSLELDQPTPLAMSDLFHSKATRIVQKVAKSDPSLADCSLSLDLLCSEKFRLSAAPPWPFLPLTELILSKISVYDRCSKRLAHTSWLVDVLLVLPALRELTVSVDRVDQSRAEPKMYERSQAMWRQFFQALDAGRRHRPLHRLSVAQYDSARFYSPKPGRPARPFAPLFDLHLAARVARSVRHFALAGLFRSQDVACLFRQLVRPDDELVRPDDDGALLPPARLERLSVRAIELRNDVELNSDDDGDRDDDDDDNSNQQNNRNNNVLESALAQLLASRAIGTQLRGFSLELQVDLGDAELIGGVRAATRLERLALRPLLGREDNFAAQCHRLVVAVPPSLRRLALRQADDDCRNVMPAYLYEATAQAMLRAVEERRQEKRPFRVARLHLLGRELQHGGAQTIINKHDRFCRLAQLFRVVAQNRRAKKKAQVRRTGLALCFLQCHRRARRAVLGDPTQAVPRSHLGLVPEFIAQTIAQLVHHSGE